MFDGLFEIFAKTMSVFYDLVPNYAVAIALLTLAVMVVTTPFTLKGTRSMIQLQRLQPEMKRLQVKYKDDRQKLNEELMAFYKEHSVNPLGGCLPLLLQMPIFLILFRVVRGLVHENGKGQFEPKYLHKSSQLYQDLFHATHMKSFGIDLAQSASTALKDGFTHGLPLVALVAVVAMSSYYQQKQIQGRNPNAEIPAQQKMLMRLMPAMFVVFAFVSPGALVIYFVVSNLYRIAMQAYITRTLYHGEDSLGAQAQRAANEMKRQKDEKAGPGSGDALPRIGKRKDVLDAGASPITDTKPAMPTPRTSSNGSGPKPPQPRTGASNRSKKKKKRR